jgi:carboxyl-terminal processing protease
VLVGPESASSAEVFAAALQHHRRAILVGKTTAGSVMTSRLFSLPDGGTLSLAVSEFVAPDGRRLEGVGVRPDVDAISTLAAVRAGRDILLEAAIAALEARATEVPEA